MADKFEKAVYYVRNAPPTESSNEEKLKVYALFKQVFISLLFGFKFPPMCSFLFDRPPLGMWKAPNLGPSKWRLVPSGMLGTPSRLENGSSFVSLSFRAE